MISRNGRICAWKVARGFERWGAEPRPCLVVDGVPDGGGAGHRAGEGSTGLLVVALRDRALVLGENPEGLRGELVDETVVFGPVGSGRTASVS